MSRRRRHASSSSLRTRRPAPVRLLQAALVVVLVGPLTTAQVEAHAEPQKVLQSVDVALGTDGSITAIDSTAVAQAGSGDPTVDETALDPTENAGGLPVRVATTWRLGGRSGTDLADIAGKKGRVVIDVTVQNTTVKPQKVSYDAGGVSREQYALVGAPLTVIASAGLGGSLATVVTENTSAPGEVTNGVLSVSEKGGTQVQWSALLAPPRLAPSATFRLVQETDDFQPPTLDLSVQPGLVTDSSIEGLLNAAFSDDRDSTLQMESRTIELVGDVNAVLTEAGSVLSQIESQLDGSADRLGTQALADLEASSNHVTSSLSGLSSDLDSLSSTMEGALDQGNAAVLDGLLDALTGVKELLGDPRKITPPQLGTVRGCAIPDISGGSQTTSVYEQLLLVGAQLNTLRSASTDCSSVISRSLRTSVGSTSATCLPGDRSAVCALDQARDQLGDQASQLAGLKAHLLDNLDQEGVAQLGTDLLDLRTQLGAIQTTAEGLADPADGESGLESLITAISQLRTDMIGLQGDLGDVSVAGLLSAVGDIKGIAEGQLTAIGSTSEPDSLLGRAQAAADLVQQACALPGGYDATLLPPQVSSYLDATTQSCTDAGSRAAEVVAGLTASRDQWNAVLDKSDLEGDAEAIEESLTGLGTAVQTIVTNLGTLLSGDVSTVTDGIDELSDTLDDLYDASRVPGGCVGTPPSNAPLNVVLRSYQRVSCNVASLSTAIDDRFQDLDATLLEGQGELGDGMVAADQARVEAERNVQLLTSQLGVSMATVSQQLRTEGRRKIEARRASLDSQFSAFGRTLDRRTKAAVNAIASNVGASNRSLGDSEQRLTSDISKVIVDLGSNSENGTGLLGAIKSGASRTGLSNQQISAANEKTAAFGGQRTRELDQIYLQQAQVSASLEQLTAFPSLGLDLPEGSQTLTVYSFHLGGK